MNILPLTRKRTFEETKLAIQPEEKDIKNKREAFSMKTQEGEVRKPAMEFIAIGEENPLVRTEISHQPWTIMEAHLWRIRHRQQYSHQLRIRGRQISSDKHIHFLLRWYLHQWLLIPQLWLRLICQCPCLIAMKIQRIPYSFPI